MTSKDTLLIQLARISKLTKASKLMRICSSPIAYFRLLKYKIKPSVKQFEVSTILGVPMSILMPSAQDIFLFGCKTHDSEIRLSKYFIKQLPEARCFIDVGAHFGFFSVLASQVMRSDAAIFSIEPSIQSFSILQKNISPKPNIEAHQLALTNCNGAIDFKELPVKYLEYNALDHTQYETKDWYDKSNLKSYSIKTFTGDRLFANCKNIDLIKIDVEGSELLVLEGMNNIIDQFKPIIILEIQQHSKVHQDAISFLFNRHYKSFAITDEGELEAFNALEHIVNDSENVVFILPTDSVD